MRVAGKGTRILIIVGPTGVGKTTTIAKLAAIHGIGDGRQPPRKVRIITIDNYRIAAKQQIETYAEIMRIPVSLVESASDLQNCLAFNQDAELILIDTIGRSPRDLAKLAEMKEILAACGSQACVYLALSATTKASDTEEILRQFEPFGYRAVVLTKLDETMRIGNIVPCLSRHRKPIAYLCDGQGVPQDIQEAGVVRLLMNMEGFRVDREALEKRFARGRAGTAGGRAAAFHDGWRKLAYRQGCRRRASQGWRKLAYRQGRRRRASQGWRKLAHRQGRRRRASEKPAGSR